MDVRILGPFEVLDGEHPVALPAGRGRALLALLAINPSEVVGTDRIIDELWGQTPPATVTTALHGLVSTLRKRLEADRTPEQEPSVLRTVSPGYALDIDPMDLDATRFRRAVDAAMGEPAAASAAILREALATWRGPALAEFAFEPFAQSEITALNDLRLVAIEELIDADIALGRHADVVGELVSLVVEHPFRERLRGQLMLALYRSGRQSDALDAYRATRTTLVDELGIEPGPVLRDLERAILNQDPQLDGDDRSASSWLGRERRLVTVVYADVAASSDMDPETTDEPTLDAATHILRRHGASVEREMDDTLVGLFGYPVAYEDDAHRAVRAAIVLRDRFRARVGIDTGDVVIGHLARVSGTPLRAASRLVRTANHGRITIGDMTHAVIGTSATVERSGDAWTLVEIEPDAVPLPRQLDVAMVGRGRELAQLRSAFDRVVADGTPYRFTVLGQAGIGKSRLAADLTASIEARVLAGRCPAYGEGITLLPLREMGFVADTDGDLASAVRKFVEDAAADGPAVLVFEDIHWAEPTLLDLITDVTDQATGPLFIVCLSRPDLLDARPAWGVGGRNADTLFLEPLSRDDVTELIAARLGERTLLPQAIDRLIDIAGGNPLFVEQLLASGAGASTPEVRPGVHALLAARLDRLGPAERDLLRIASVIGSDFTLGAVAELAPDDARPALARHIEGLVRKQLVRVRGSGFAFAHGLIQVAAYRSTTKDVRADLHEHLADQLAGTELDEVVGYHLEQAHRARVELNPDDPRSESLRARAGEHLVGAGLRAAERYDVSAAANLLDRAVRLLRPGPRRLKAARRLAEACQALGRTSEADAALAAMFDEAELAGDRTLAQVAKLERVRLLLATGPDPVTLEDIRSEAQQTIDLVRDDGDDAVLALAHYVLWMAHYRAGDTDQMDAEARRCLHHADRSGSAREAVSARIALSWNQVAGPAPVDGAIEVCEGLRDVGGLEHPIVAGDVAMLRAMADDIDGARSCIAAARALTLADDSRARQVVLARSAADVERLAGDAVAARRELRFALDHALDGHMHEAIAQAAALLARSWAEAGDLEQADGLSAMSREQAPRESVAAQALWRMASAVISSARAAHAEAIALAEAAVDILPPGMLNLCGDAFAVLADVLAAAGRDATIVKSEAIAAYEAKGNTIAARRLRTAVPAGEGT